MHFNWKIFHISYDQASENRILSSVCLPILHTPRELQLREKTRYIVWSSGLRSSGEKLGAQATILACGISLMPLGGDIGGKVGLSGALQVRFGHLLHIRLKHILGAHPRTQFLLLLRKIV